MTARSIQTAAMAAIVMSVSCTSVAVRESAVSGASQGPSGIRIARVTVDIDHAAVQPDRVARLEEIGTTTALQKKLTEYLGIAELGSDLGGDLNLQINEFRLPNSARWFTGSFKGNDYLGAAVSLVQSSDVLYRADIRVQLGAGDRSVGANYSADWAHGSLVDMLAWEVAWGLTGVAGHGENALLLAGKNDGVKRAIIILAHRGLLPYGELVKYAAMGKVGVENSDLGPRYDACALRWIFTLGFSPCRWEPTYR